MLVSPVIPHEGIIEAKQVGQKILTVHLQPQTHQILQRRLNAEKEGKSISQSMVQNMTTLLSAWRYS